VDGQDLGALYLEVSGTSGQGEKLFMAYRTVKEFPILGDVINKAVEQVVSGQLSGRDAMNAARSRRCQISAAPEAHFAATNLIDAERRSSIAGRWRRAWSFCVIAALPALYLLAASLTPFQLVNPGSSTEFQRAFTELSPAPGDPRFIHH